MNERKGQTMKAPSVHQSCDSCQASKVRCGKERPTCKRCAKHKIDCVYSVSRRAGRPRPRRADSSTSFITGSTTDPEIIPALPRIPTSIATASSNTSATPVSLASAPLIPSDTGQHVEAVHKGTISEQQHLEPVAGTNLGFDMISFPQTSLAEFTTSIPQEDSSAWAFDSIFGPLQHIGEPNEQYKLSFDNLSEGSDSSPTNMDVSISNANEDCLVDRISMSEACFCSTTLLQQLADLSAPANSMQKDRHLRETSPNTMAVQKSKALLDYCLSVLCCTRCGPRYSSALIICYGIDEISISFGMGTLWGEVSSDRLPIGNAVARDEFNLRFGSYSVKDTDRRALLRVLALKRLNKMQRVIGRLHQIIQQAFIVKSPHHAICADMVSELARNIQARIGLIEMIVR